MKNCSTPLLPRHERWEEFIESLAGPGCCDWKDDWTCFGDLRFTRKLLKDMGLSASDQAVTIQYFRDHGGYCDCEVLMNVDRRQ